MDKLTKNLEEAARQLKLGNLAAIPTETVYGLAGDATNQDAVRKIFETKNRPADNPLIIHFLNLVHLNEFADFSFSLLERALYCAFCPGPLTFLKETASTKVTPVALAGCRKMCVRFPSHILTRRLLELTRTPLAAPSANKSGRPSCTDSLSCCEEFASDKNVACVLDGGECEKGLESTIIEVNEPNSVVILRKGAVTKEQIEIVLSNLGNVKVVVEFVNTKESLKDVVPGNKYKHYAPNCPLEVISKTFVQKSKKFRDFLVKSFQKNGPISVVGLKDSLENVKKEKGISFFSFENVQELGKELFRTFRKCEANGSQKIYVIEIDRSGLGATVMERVEKASNGIYLDTDYN